MNAAVPDFKRQKTAALSALLGMSLIVGVLAGSLASSGHINDNMLPLQWFGNLAMLLIGFYWLHFDGRELGIRRPTWLSVGIVLLALVFVPYYLYKTRPAGHRGTAILAFFGVVFGCFVGMLIGASIIIALQGGASGA